MVSSSYARNKMKLLNSVGTNKKSNKVRCNLPTTHTQPESCDNMGKDSILDISGVLVIYDNVLIDVYPGNSQICLNTDAFSDNHNVTKDNPSVCISSNLNPYADIFVMNEDDTIPQIRGGGGGGFETLRSLVGKSFRYQGLFLQFH